MPAFNGVAAIVTDIEGTTSSIAFVHEVLFPYARRQMAEFVRGNADDPQVAAELAHIDAGSLDEKIGQLIDWIDNDQKVTALKSLQGMIWRQGYRAGDFTGHVYDDAARGLRQWSGQGIALYVYSSGSVQAQQLLFRYSDAGDLSTLFDGYFDTRTGAKRDPAAYRKISQQTGHDAAAMLFLSDVGDELDAARDAGMQTCWLLRDREPPTDPAHPVARDFEEIRVN